MLDNRAESSPSGPVRTGCDQTLEPQISVRHGGLLLIMEQLQQVITSVNGVDPDIHPGRNQIETRPTDLGHGDAVSGVEMAENGLLLVNCLP